MKNGLQKDLDLKSSELAQLTTQTKNLEQQVNDCKSKYPTEQEKVAKWMLKRGEIWNKSGRLVL